MSKPNMNYCAKHEVMVLADESYGPIEVCKGCYTKANLDDGLCEACYDHKHNATRTRS